MQKVFSARDITEAHIIKGLLESHDIPAQVDGAYLQGAFGELPVVDLITVSVAKEQVMHAKKLIEEYDQATPELPIST